MTEAAATPIEVVGAVVIRDGLVLCARRGAAQHMAGRWEFPGGKVEPGETPEAALAREIEEELGCGIRVGDVVASVVHAYPHATIALTTFRCALVDGEPAAIEHDELRWVAASALADLEWAPADLPTVVALADLGT